MECRSFRLPSPLDQERCLEHPGQSTLPRRPQLSPVASHLHRAPGGVHGPRRRESARALPRGRRRLDLEPPRPQARSREVWTQSLTARGWLMGSDGGPCHDTRHQHDRKLDLIMQIKSEIFSSLIMGYIFSFYLTLPLSPKRRRCLKVAFLSLGSQAGENVREKNYYSLMLYECGTVELERLDIRPILSF